MNRTIQYNWETMNTNIKWGTFGGLKKEQINNKHKAASNIKKNQAQRYQHQHVCLRSPPPGRRTGENESPSSIWATGRQVWVTAGHPDTPAGKQENRKTGQQLCLSHSYVTITMVSCVPAPWSYYYNGFFWKTGNHYNSKSRELETGNHYNSKSNKLGNRKPL